MKDDFYDLVFTILLLAAQGRNLSEREREARKEEAREEEEATGGRRASFWNDL